MSEPPATRICRVCGVEKPLDREHFTPAEGYAWGFHFRCKPCRNARERERYRDDPELAQYIRDYSKSRYGRSLTREQFEERYPRRAAVDNAPPAI